jgi:hypothetical protein
MPPPPPAITAVTEAAPTTTTASTRSLSSSVSAARRRDAKRKLRAASRTSRLRASAMGRVRSCDTLSSLARHDDLTFVANDEIDDDDDDDGDEGTMAAGRRDVTERVYWERYERRLFQRQVRVVPCCVRALCACLCAIHCLTHARSSSGVRRRARSASWVACRSRLRAGCVCWCVIAWRCVTALCASLLIAIAVEARPGAQSAVRSRRVRAA